MTDELKGLSDLLDLLRLKGVSNYSGLCGANNLVNVTLGLSADNIEDARPATSLDPDNCRCNHPMHAHTAGLCLLGCPLDACAPIAPAKEV